MADYPAYSIMKGSEATPITGIRIDRASTGKPLAQSFHDKTRKSFHVVHYLKRDDVAALKTFFENNKLNTFTFDWVDGNTYTVIFGENGVQVTPLPGLYWDVTVHMEEI